MPTALAVHEAAHIIVAKLFGLRMTQIDREENGVEAEVSFDQGSPSAAARNLEDALIGKAGELAEFRAGHKPEAGDIAGDRRTVGRAIIELDGRGQVEQYRSGNGIGAICDALLGREDVWTAIVGLADLIDANPAADAKTINDFVDRLNL